MYELSQNELINISGGAVTLTAGAFIISGIVFIIGVIDGYLRPLRCR